MKDNIDAVIRGLVIVVGVGAVIVLALGLFETRPEAANLATGALIALVTAATQYLFRGKAVVTPNTGPDQYVEVSRRRPAATVTESHSGDTGKPSGA